MAARRPCLLVLLALALVCVCATPRAVNHAIYPKHLFSPGRRHVALVQQQPGKFVVGSLDVSAVSTHLSIELNDNEWWDSAIGSCKDQFDRPRECDISELRPLLKRAVRNCTMCASSQWEASPCSATSDRECRPCSTRKDGQYLARACSEKEDADYRPCKDRCSAGAYQTVACTDHSDRACTNCTNRGSTSYITNACVADIDDGSNGHDANFDECQVCTEGVTFEVGPCGGETGLDDRKCEWCSICGSNSYTYTPCSLTANTVCMTCSICQLGRTYQTVECGAYLDTQCTPCTACTDNQYETQACTMSSDRTCKDCSPVPSGYYVTAHCNATSDNQFKACSTDCQSDHYIAKECTPRSNLLCATCSTCDSGTFLKVACTKISDTVCSRCTSCNTGKYVTGDCHDDKDTECSACLECGVGEVLVSACGGSNNTVCAACTPVPNADFTTKGSCAFTCKQSYRLSTDGKSCYACNTCSDTQYTLSPCSEHGNSVCRVKGRIGFLQVNETDARNPGLIDLTGLEFAFKKPVVILGPPTSLGSSSCVLRVAETSLPLGYHVFIAQPPYVTAHHPVEYTNYVVFEEGAGSNYYAGSAQLTDTSFVDVMLPQAAGKLPFVFPMIQSNNNGAHATAATLPLKGFVKVRRTLAGNSPTTIRLKLETYDGFQGTLESETVGYLAIDSGCSQTQTQGDASSLTSICANQTGKISLDSVTYDYQLGVVLTSSLNPTYPVGFVKAFKSVPFIFASMQSFIGSTSAEIRTLDATVSGFRFVVEGAVQATTTTTTTSNDSSSSESSSSSSESNDGSGNSDASGHASEWVAWLAIGFL